MPIIYESSADDVRRDVEYMFEERKELSGDPAVNGGQRSSERALTGHSPLLVKYTETHKVPVIAASADAIEKDPVSVDMPTSEKMADFSHSHQPDILVAGSEKVDPVTDGPKLVLKSTLPVSSWFYKGCDGECPICMQSLMKLCPACESGKSKTHCVINIGECGHAIHEHCFGEFVSKRSCSLCRQPWILNQASALK